MFLFGARIAQAVQSLQVQQLSTGNNFTCATVSGGVQCWGFNDVGQLGHATTIDRAVTAPVSGLTSAATAIATGNDHACAIVNGGAQCWGNDGSGQLGNGSMNAGSDVPVTVQGFSSGATAIAAGGNHSCALVNGGVQCWGYNTDGELGNSSNAASSTPVQVTGLGSGATAITAGYYHTCAIVNGGVQCWGSNVVGQLGNTSNTGSTIPVSVTNLGPGSGVTAIAAGDLQTCAVANGAVLCWGGNSNGQLGNNSTTDSNFPVATTGLTSGATAVAAAATHSCAIVSGSARCWGDNLYGELGNGTSASSNVPVTVSTIGVTSVSAIAAGATHTCAKVVTTGGLTQMECWGDNHYGQLGIGGVDQSATAIAVSSLASGATALSRSSEALHGCAVVNGAANCWGSNSNGQLGNGLTVDSSVPQSVNGLSSGVAMLMAGGFHSCAVVSGAAKCWGSNSNGQLGNNMIVDSAVPVAVSGLGSGTSVLAAGAAHSCAVVSGAAKCWGLNNSGQLGNNSTSESHMPAQVMGLTSGVTAITTGDTHTCAIVDGGAQCWGGDTYGQLGDGGSSTSASLVPVAVVGLTIGVTAIMAGKQHTCAIVNNGVKCWGNSFTGQLGNGSAVDRTSSPVDVTGLTTGVSAITTGGNHNCALVSGGLQCWGDNSSYQLGNNKMTQSLTPVVVGGLTSGVTAIGAGQIHTCAVVTGGGVKCWGDNHDGQLGDGRFLTGETPQVVVAGDEIFGNGFEGINSGLVD